MRISSILNGSVLLSVFLLVSCSAMQMPSSTPVAPVAKKTIPVETLSCVVVMPARVPEAGIRMPGNRPEDGAVYLDSLLPKMLQEAGVSRVVESEQLQMSKGTTGDGPLLQQIGRELGCPNILIPSVTRYEQRQGSDMGVDSPAAATFDFQLRDVEKGRVLWTATFNERQQSLSENLLAYGKAKKRGFKWITVEELVRQGLQEKLAECPYITKQKQ